MSSDKSNQLLIREAIRKIALGRSMERIGMAPGGMSGIGTARMIHGYVAKIHDDPSDEEFAEYGGTVDVGKYPDETAVASALPTRKLCDFTSQSFSRPVTFNTFGTRA